MVGSAAEHGQPELDTEGLSILLGPESDPFKGLSPASPNTWLADCEGTREALGGLCYAISLMLLSPRLAAMAAAEIHAYGRFLSGETGATRRGDGRIVSTCAGSKKSRFA